MTDLSRYPFEVFWSDEDNGYVAIAPDLPGCSAFGKSRSEALNEVETAAELWLRAARQAGNPVPEPAQPQPVSFSGKFALRMPVSLHVKAARFAQTDNTSLNQLINVAIAQYLGAREVTAAASTHSHSFYSAVSAPGVGVVGQGYVSEAVTLALEHLTLQSTSNSYVLLDNPSYIEHWPLARASIYPTPKREPFDIYFGGSHSVAPLKHG